MFNPEDGKDLNLYLKGQVRQITVPGAKEKITYDPLTRFGVGVTQIDTRTAIAIGAYSFAFSKLS